MINLLNMVKKVSEEKILLERILENNIDTGFIFLSNIMIEDEKFKISYEKPILKMESELNPEDSYSFNLDCVDNLFYANKDHSALFIIWYDSDMEISNLTCFTNFELVGDKIKNLIAEESFNKFIKEN